MCVGPTPGVGYTYKPNRTMESKAPGEPGTQYHSRNSEFGPNPKALMKLTILGLGHEVQWKDPTGDLETMLSELLRKSPVELIAEEAYKLPTTVGQRLACRLNTPWLQVDMNEEQRRKEGIFEALEKRPGFPKILCADTPYEYHECYLPYEDDARERYWVSRLIAQGVSCALVLCAPLHLDPLAQKLGSRGCTLQLIKVWERDWYSVQFGRSEIFEKDGQRCYGVYPRRLP